MKPNNWDKMNSGQKRYTATKLLGSLRGQLLLSQALVRAIEVMKTDKYPENSNIEEMEMLVEMLFPLYAAARDAEKYFKNGGDTLA
jgi:hypothetical protein